MASGGELHAGDRLGHFRLTGRLGAGGMGVVYSAEDERLRRKVAIKVLAGEAMDDTERRARFLREARSAAAVSHPCIATVHAIEESSAGQVYLVMELVEGQTLRAHLAARGRLGEAEAIHLALEMARGLARAHGVGIVHRDLKPDNVMIGTEGEVKILDFGLAKPCAAVLESGGDRPAAGSPAVDEVALTGEGGILGTPGYMAPEQIRGERVDPRADIFAFGAILYELVSGRRAFAAGTLLGVMAAVLTEEPPALVEASPALQALVSRCLAKAPADRPVDATALVSSLLALATGSGSTTSALQAASGRVPGPTAPPAAPAGLTADEAAETMMAAGQHALPGADLPAPTGQEPVPVLSVRSVDGNTLIRCVHDVVRVRNLDVVRPSSIPIGDELIAALRRRGLSRVAWIVEIDTQVPFPDEVTRAELDRFYARNADHLIAAVFVVLGTGFRASIVRSVLSSSGYVTNLVVRRKYPTKVVGSLPDAVSWLERHVPPSVAGRPPVGVISALLAGDGD